MRPHIYETFSEIASSLAQRSSCSARAAVGAILYDDHYRLIATGYNGSPFGFAHCDEVGCNFDESGHCQNSIHAEENAIIQCAVVGRPTSGLSLFTTHIPCWRCTMRILQAGIIRVTYMKDYGRDVVKSIEVFSKYGIPVEEYLGWKK